MRRQASGAAVGMREDGGARALWSGIDEHRATGPRRSTPPAAARRVRGWSPVAGSRATPASRAAVLRGRCGAEPLRRDRIARARACPERGHVAPFNLEYGPFTLD